MSHTALAAAYAAWEAMLGNGRALTSAEAQKRYGASTLHASQRRIAGGLLPETTDEVIALVRIAAAHRISLYPISTGHNWGYGSASPITDDCVVVDLSGMRGVIGVDERLGLATLEPGVTSGQLQSYLDERSIPFRAPVTGGGSDCSIVGNVLERGRSNNAPVDRFSSVMALEAVLADGTLYRSVSSAPSSPAHGFFKWGMGPYLDGLFGQSNIGIVVRMTIALSSEPRYAESFLISTKEGASLAGFIECVRDALQTLGSTLPTIKVMNAHRVVAQAVRYPYGAWATDRQTIPDAFIEKTLQSLSLSSWTIVGTLEGDPRLVKAAKKVVRHAFRHSAGRIFFFTDATLRALAVLERYVPSIHLPRRLLAAIRAVRSSSHARAGRAKQAKPRLPFWKTWRRGPFSLGPTADADAADYDLNPYCGLLTVPVVLPMRGNTVEAFAKEAEAICKTHGLEPLIGILNFSDRCVFISIQLLFDKSNEAQERAARSGYAELDAASRAYGGYIYRRTIDTMAGVAHPDDSFMQTARKIKKALDPDNIIAPGRYSL